VSRTLRRGEEPLLHFFAAASTPLFFATENYVDDRSNRLFITGAQWQRSGENVADCVDVRVLPVAKTTRQQNHTEILLPPPLPLLRPRAGALGP